MRWSLPAILSRALRRNPKWSSSSVWRAWWTDWATRRSLAYETYVVGAVSCRVSCVCVRVYLATHLCAQIRGAATAPAGLRKEELEAKAEARVDAALQLLFGFLNSSHLEVSGATFELNSLYLQHLKQSGASTEKAAQQLKTLLVLLSAKMRQLEGVKASHDNEVRNTHTQNATQCRAYTQVDRG